MLRVVLDTQCWVSALAVPRGKPGRIVRLALEGELRLVTSPAIHEEVLAVFARPHVARLFPAAVDPASWLAAVELGAADMVEASLGPPLSTDPKDDPFLWAAYVGRATHVVSKDPDLLGLKHYRGASILDPTGFVAEWLSRRLSETSPDPEHADEVERRRREDKE